MIGLKIWLWLSTLVLVCLSVIFTHAPIARGKPLWIVPVVVIFFGAWLLWFTWTISSKVYSLALDHDGHMTNNWNMANLKANENFRRWANVRQIAERFAVDTLTHSIRLEQDLSILDPYMFEYAMEGLARSCYAAVEKTNRIQGTKGIDSDDYEDANDEFRECKKKYWAIADHLAIKNLREKKSEWKLDLPEDVRIIDELNRFDR